jgi:uncharacterized protein YndB with AHSA1/START domain
MKRHPSWPATEADPMASDSGGLTLHLERVLPASPEEVFDACIDPAKLAEWWGPAGFTSPSLELDARDGGRYRITMQPPGGEAFHLRGEFREIDRRGASSTRSCGRNRTPTTRRRW